MMPEREVAVCSADEGQQAQNSCPELCIFFLLVSHGVLLHVLHRVKKGKCRTKELVALLETAIRLTGNAAAHLSMERRKALLKHLHSDLKSLAEGDFSDHCPLLFGKDFASKANPQPTMSKLLKASYQGRVFPGAASKTKGKASSLRVAAHTGAHSSTPMARDFRPVAGQPGSNYSQFVPVSPSGKDSSFPFAKSLLTHGTCRQ